MWPICRSGALFVRYQPSRIIEVQCRLMHEVVSLGEIVNRHNITRLANKLKKSHKSFIIKLYARKSAESSGERGVSCNQWVMNPETVVR